MGQRMEGVHSEMVVRIADELTSLRGLSLDGDPEAVYRWVHVRVVHSQVASCNLSQLADVDTGFPEHCHSLTGSEGPTRRWAIDLEQIGCLRDCRKDRDRKQIGRDSLMRNDGVH